MARVLIVEDENVEAMDLKQILENLGHQVIYLASHGEEAIKKIKELDPDIILMDIILKGDIDGVDVAKTIKKYNIPLIYVTAYSERSIFQRALKTQPYGYILKPFNAHEIELALELALYKHKTIQSQNNLLKQEEINRLLVENAGIGIGYYDTQGRVIMYNKLALKHMNMKAEDVKGKTAYELFGQKSGDLYTKRIEKALKSEESHFYEDKVKQKTGIKWYLSIYSRIKDEFGRIIGVQVLYSDISELKQAKEHRDLFFNYSLDMLCIAGFDFCFKQVNLAWERILGWKEDELISKSYLDFIHPKDRKATIQAGKKLQEGKPTIKFINRFRCKDGSYRWLSWNFYPLLEQQLIFSTVRDITQQIESEKKLRESKERYRSVIENMQDVFYRTDKKGKLIMISPSGSELLGYRSVNELLGKNFTETLFPIASQREKFLNILNKESSVKDFEIELKKSDGTIITVSTTSHIYYDDKRNPQGIEGIIKDITQHKEAERKLKYSQQRTSQIINFLPDATLVIDQQGRVITWNKAMEKLTGIKAETMLGKGDYAYSIPFYGKKRPILVDLVNKSDEELEKHYYYIHREDEVIVGETEAYLKGKKRILWGKASPLYDAEGCFIGAIEAIRDITDYRNAERIIKNSLKEQEIVSQVVMQLMEAKEAREILLVIGRAVKKLLPHSYVIISSLTPDNKELKIIEILGLKKGLNKIKNIGLNPFELSFPISEISPEDMRSYQSGLLVQAENGIYDLVLGKIPRSICNLIEQILKVTEVHSIGFSWHGQHYGGLTIALREGQILEHKEVIENIVRQASLAIERSIAEDALKESLEEKEVLIREIHHRVKNNMQIISSLLNLQSQYVEGEETQNVLQESQGRVRSMAMIHEKLYQSTDLSHVNLQDYIQNLVGNIFYTYGVSSEVIKSNIVVDDVELELETAIPLGLIVNELVTNSLKYAFPSGRKGEVNILLRARNKHIELVISDDGVGLPSDLNIRSTPTLGMQLVNNLVRQIDGEISLDKSRGTKFTITFQEPEYKKRI